MSVGGVVSPVVPNKPTTVETQQKKKTSSTTEPDIKKIKADPKKDHAIETLQRNQLGIIKRIFQPKKLRQMDQLEAKFAKKYETARESGITTLDQAKPIKELYKNYKAVKKDMGSLNPSETNAITKFRKGFRALRSDIIKKSLTNKVSPKDFAKMGKLLMDFKKNNVTNKALLTILDQVEIQHHKISWGKNTGTIAYVLHEGKETKIGIKGSDGTKEVFTIIGDKVTDSQGNTVENVLVSTTGDPSDPMAKQYNAALGLANAINLTARMDHARLDSLNDKFEAKYKSAIKGGFDKSKSAKPIKELNQTFQAVTKDIDSLNTSETEAVTQFQVDFRAQKNQIIEKSLSGSISAKDFTNIDTVLRDFHKANIKGKNLDPAHPMVKHYKAALQLVNALKIPFILDQYVPLDPNATSIETLSKFLMEVVNNVINPNYDPATSGIITSLDSLDKMNARDEKIKLVRELGSVTGGGRVILGTDRKTNKSRAVKMFSNRGTPDMQKTRLERILIELHANSLLKGMPHIVSMGEANMYEGECMFDMDYSEDGTLEDHLHNHTLSPDEISLVMYEIGVTINEMRKRGIIYQDLKPNNIMIELDKKTEKIAHIKIFDFDILKVLPNMGLTAGSESETQQGTNGYCIPNEFSSDNGNLGDLEKQGTFGPMALTLLLVAKENGETRKDGTKNFSGGNLGGLFNLGIAKNNLKEAEDKLAKPDTKTMSPEDKKNLAWKRDQLKFMVGTDKSSGLSHKQSNRMPFGEFLAHWPKPKTVT